jgi:hypothetical protein
MRTQKEEKNVETKNKTRNDEETEFIKFLRIFFFMVLLWCYLGVLWFQINTKVGLKRGNHQFLFMVSPMVLFALFFHWGTPKTHLRFFLKITTQRLHALNVVFTLAKELDVSKNMNFLPSF